MAFNPSSTINLCTVPIDSTYKNQIYFASKEAQYAYFSGKTGLRFTEYLTIRETLPDGSLQSAVKVAANIDDLRGYNYMFYQNANHGSRFFYAFITKLVYVSEKTTKIIFETDVYQTWRFDVTLLDSYVVREHSTTDNIGDNTIPEKFDCVNYQKRERGLLGGEATFLTWGYLVGSANPRPADIDEWKGRLHSGIYQGLYYYYFETVNGLNTAIDELETAHGECIQFIALIPRFCVSNSEMRDNGFVKSVAAPNSTSATLNIGLGQNGEFGGYTPKNKKLYTYPYTKLVITNNSGEQADYRLEWFANPNTVNFTIYGDISANPSITAIPRGYKASSSETDTLFYDDGISLTNFPQCSYNTDTYKLWLAKNQFGIALETAGNLANIGVGLGSTIAGNPLGLTQAMSGVMGVLGTINADYQARKEPNSTKGGSTASNLKTAIKRNCMQWFIYSIRKEQARTIDDFFTMFGYQTNRVKVPNVSSRPAFNYVQTVDVNISGGIPSDDMAKLKNMYNSGVTFWKSNVTVGDYSVNNSP